ncbi:MAG: hypothetical protein R2865_06265 [Deinococcales bacterium]
MSTLGESAIGGGLLKSQALAVLADMMKIHAVAICIYGLAFFLVPEFTLRVVFGFNDLPSTLTLHNRTMFLATALAEWNCTQNVDKCLSMAWFFILTPMLILASLVWEKLSGGYQGTELFFWTQSL